ncbi:hypothetical protein BDY24DRAFT_133023 [Mrakia frigida]|uniref:uncharacterized protein n=1 Tax=Mrakia frigida TaxID=29902 RepID=UPI003FCC0A9E
MNTPPQPLASHLAILARLELLHQSGILSSSFEPGGEPPALLIEHDAVPLEFDERVSLDEKAEVQREKKEGGGGGNEAWREVGELLRLLGDGLRDESLRLPLGRTSLPLALSDILRLALEKPPFTSSLSPSSSISTPTPTTESPGLPSRSSTPCPEGDQADAIVEIYRVAGNMCFDCDENRTLLLSHQLPQSLLGLLSMLDSSPTPVKDHYPLVKSSLGALLNISLEHEGVQTLIAASEHSIEAILSLANQLYLPLESAGGESSTGPSPEERATICLWAWKTIHEVSLLDPPPTFDPASFLPLLLPPIKAFLPSTSTPSQQPPTSSLLSLDLQILSLSTQILGSQTIASETFQLALFNHPFFLSSILQFIERVDLPPTAPAPSPAADDEDEDDDESDEEEEDGGKALSLVKGTLVSVVVAVMGEDEVGELVLGGESEEEGKASEGKELREVLERWVGLALPKEDGGEEREDLGICAVLSLGNLARNESNCIALLAPPSPLLSRILPLLSPKTDLKLQHGLVGLLKNLAIPDANKSILGSARVSELVVEMGCLDKERDNVGSVQGGAVGILKFLAKGSVENALRIVLPSSSSSSTPALLHTIIAFQIRTADPALKMEAARTLVNLVRTLFSTSAAAHVGSGSRLEEARAALNSSRPVVDGLVALIRSGAEGGYLGLVGEGVMGLAVLASSGKEAASLVSASLLHLLPIQQPQPDSSVVVDPSASSSTPPPPPSLATLATLTALLSLPTTPTALKGNILSLLGAAGRGGGKEAFSRALDTSEAEDDGNLRDAREKARKILYAPGGVEDLV